MIAGAGRHRALAESRRIGGSAANAPRTYLFALLLAIPTPALALVVAACGADGAGGADAGGSVTASSGATGSTSSGAGAGGPDGGGDADAAGGGDAADAMDAGPSCPPLERAGGVVELVAAIASAMDASAGPDTNALVLPSASDRDAFAAKVLGALGGDDVAACSLPPSYRRVHLVDPSAGGVLAVAELDATGAPAPALYWGTFAAVADPKEAPTRALVVEAPHPLFDTRTWMEAADVFAHARARYLLVAGAHRCSSADPSPCTGQTTACGGALAPFRVSDTAHAVGPPFFAVHAAISASAPAIVFLQLHGNDAACPDALVSDSSGAFPAGGPAAAFAAALTKQGVGVGLCDGVAYPTGACNLCGTDNVEARFTAGAPNACTDKGIGYGRFVHIEQKPVLRVAPVNGQGGYAPMIAATLDAVPTE